MEKETKEGEKMTWYFFKRVKKVYNVHCPPSWLMLITFFAIQPVIEFQTGIEQINEKGEKRILWEKMDG